MVLGVVRQQPEVENEEEEKGETVLLAAVLKEERAHTRIHIRTSYDCCACFTPAESPLRKALVKISF